MTTSSSEKSKHSHQVVIWTACVGVLVYFTGGLNLRWPWDGKAEFLELNQWGLFLCPLVFVLLRDQTRSSRPAQLIKILTDTINSLRPATHSGFLITIGLFNTVAALSRYFSFNGEWDLAIYANACANGFQSSFRNHTTLLADHFEPFLAVFFPLCKVFNPAITLLIVQSGAFLLGALALQKLTLNFGFSRIQSLFVAFAYLAFSGTQTIHYYDFHLYSLSLATIPLMMLALAECRWILFCIVALIHLCLKETTSLFLAGLGLYLLLSRDFPKHRRLLGTTLLIFGVLSFIVIMRFVFPHFRSGQESEYFAKYYGHLGRNLNELVMTAVTQPNVIFEHLFGWPRVKYLFFTALPFLFVPLFRPLMILPIAATLGVNMLSSAEEMHSGQFHYDAEIYAWLFCATLVALKTAQAMQIPRTQFKIKLTHVLTMMFLFFSATSPVARIARYSPSRAHATLGAKLNSLVHELGDCRTSAIERLGAHLARLKTITMLTDSESSEVIILAYPQGVKLWTLSRTQLENELIPKWEQSLSLVLDDQLDIQIRVYSNERCLPRVKEALKL